MNASMGDFADVVAQSKSVVVLTGAGVSAESGIPTFRDAAEGLWAQYNPMEMATPEAFEKDPELVSRWYAWRLEKCMGSQPNPGHVALAQWENQLGKCGGQFTLLSQNVDGLHQAAGSDHVLELHGSIHEWRCVRCDQISAMPPLPFSNHPPRCDACGGPRRPGVVWFGENLSADLLQKAMRALSECDLFVAIGTSAVVEPSASFVSMALAAGAVTAQINAEPTSISGAVGHQLLGPSGRILPKLMSMAWEDIC